MVELREGQVVVLVVLVAALAVVGAEPVVLELGAALVRADGADALGLYTGANVRQKPYCGKCCFALHAGRRKEAGNSPGAPIRGWGGRA